jgi:hypothetical protein
MPKDVVRLLDGVLSDEPARWAKLSSTIRWRRLQLLLLREILLELRQVRRALVEPEDPDSA